MKTEERFVDWDKALPGLTVGMIETRRGPLELARAGSGPAVLLIHGTPGSWRQAIGLAGDLFTRYQVLLPSRPGYGSTPLATGHTPAEQADAYAALLDELEIDDCAIVGISGGAPSAAEFAARHPGRTRALVLACPVAIHLMQLRRSWVVQLAVPGLAELAFFIARRRAQSRIGDPKAIEEEAGRSFTPDELARFSGEAKVRFEYFRFLRSHLDAPVGLAGMRNDVIQTRRSNDPPNFAAVSCPLLVMHGDADATVSMEQARFYASAVPNAEFEIYEKAGHLFLITRREAIPRIIEFLQGAISYEVGS